MEAAQEKAVSGTGWDGAAWLVLCPSSEAPYGGGSERVQKEEAG